MDAVGSEVRAAVEEAGGRVGEYERVGETLWAAGRVVGDGKTSWGLVQAVGEVSAGFWGAGEVDESV